MCVDIGQAVAMELSDKERVLQALNEARQRSADAHFLPRLHCVLLVEQGRSTQEVAQWYADDASSVARWLRQFNESGLEGLREGRKSGRPGKLGSEHRQALREDLRKPPTAFGYAQATWDGKLLATHLAARYAIRLSVRQCQRLLRQLLPRQPGPTV